MAATSLLRLSLSKPMDGLSLGLEVRMSVQFRGRFELKIDPKFRLTMPTAFREQLKASERRIVLTNSQYQGKRCLDAFPIAEWQKLEGRISRLPQLRREVQAFQRFYLSGGHVVECDGSGRLLIPPSLRQYASFHSEVMVVGFSNKFEIWAKEVWTSLFDSLVSSFDDTIADIAGLDEKTRGEGSDD